jgi:hypothetical protein
MMNPDMGIAGLDPYEGPPSATYPKSTDGMSDHDLLVRLDERIGSIFKWIKDHDKEHAEVTARIEKNRAMIYSSVFAAGGAIISVIVDVLLRHL